MSILDIPNSGASAPASLDASGHQVVALRSHLTGKSLRLLFSQLTGHSPFLWQRRLFRRHLLESDIPQAVDIPTGLGKTSVMALWLIALAKGANLPRRLVVDRRAVVDQATRFAERLRAEMPDDLAEALGIGRGSERLPISTLRGGFADNRDWLEDPSKPAKESLTDSERNRLRSVLHSLLG